MSRATEPSSRAGMAGGAAQPASHVTPHAHGSHSPGHSAHPSHQPSHGLSPQAVREYLVGKHVCPFCGTPNAAGTQPCPRCTMDDTPATRQATKSRIGPWYVLQARNPAAPGMRFSTLLALVHKGQVSPRSVVRGPTTHQLWRYAAHVRGLSREFGLCYSCGEAIERTAAMCPHCERPQEPPANPDQLVEVRDAGAGSASAAASGANTGNGANTGPRAPREYEIPAQPAAYPPAAYPPARTVRGEHAERLRLLNAEGSVGRARPELRRDNRVVSAMELASALQRDDPAAQEFEEGASRFGRAVGVLVLLLLVGGGVFLYLNPDYRTQASSWIVQQWQVARQKVNSFEFRKPKPAAADAPVAMPAPMPPAVASRSDRALQTESSTTDRKIAPSLPPNRALESAMRTADSAAKVPEAKTSPISPAESKPAESKPAEPKPPEPKPAQVKVAEAKAAEPKVQTNKDELKKAIDTGNATPPDANSKPADVGKAPATQPDSSPAAPPAVAANEKKEDKKDAPPPASPSPSDASVAVPVEAISPEAALEMARALRNKAIDAESAHDFAQALKYWEEIKKLPKTAWPGDLQNRIDIAKALRDEK